MRLSFPHIPFFPLYQLAFLFYPLQVLFPISSPIYSFFSAFVVRLRWTTFSVEHCDAAQLWWWVFILQFPVVRNLWVRFSHVMYFRVSQNSDEAVHGGANPTPRKCGNVGMRMRTSLGDTPQTPQTLIFFFFFWGRETGYLLSLEFIDLASQWVLESHLSPSLHCWGYKRIPLSLTSFCFSHGSWGSNLGPHACEHFILSHLPAPWRGLFWGLTVSGFISKFTLEALARASNTDLWLVLPGIWKRHRESYLQILEVAKRVTLLSFLALFFIWGLERVAARGRKPFETWSSSNWDKLKEMLLCRVESDLWEYYIPKAKGWEYTQIKSTSDIVINYVYENNPNGQQYGNS